MKHLENLNRPNSRAHHLTEEILSHISFLAFENAQLVFSPRLRGQIWLLEATEEEAGGESCANKKKKRESSSLHIHEIIPSLHLNNSDVRG